MPAKLKFTLAEHQAIYEVVKSFNGTVGREGGPCIITIQHRIGKTISAPTARDYYRSWNAELLGELKAERKGILKEALNRGQPQPETVKTGETSESFAEPDIFTDQSLATIENQPVDERIEWVLKRLLKLTADDIDAIAPEKRVRLLGPTADTWIRTRGLTPEFVERWAGKIEEYIELCQDVGRVPEQLFDDILERLRREASQSLLAVTSGSEVSQ